MGFGCVRSGHQKPAGQVVHDWDPAAAYVPVGHNLAGETHGKGFVTGHAYPTGQTLHSVTSSPSNVYVPFLHFSIALDVWKGQMCPAGHGVQSSCPATEYCPTCVEVDQGYRRAPRHSGPLAPPPAPVELPPGLT